MNVLKNFFVALLIPISSLYSGDFRFEGSQWTSYLLDQSDLARTRFEGTLLWKKSFGENWNFEASARGFVDPFVQSSDRLSTDVKASEGRDLELRAVNAEYQNLPLRVRLGLQEVVWGEALHFFSADVLHPKDYRDLFLNSLSWSRRPQMGVSGIYESDLMSLNLVYFPVSRVNRYPEFGSDFFLPEFSVESLGLPQAAGEGFWTWDEPTLGVNLGLRFSELQLNVLGAWIRDPQGYYRDGRVRNDSILVSGLTGSYASEEWILRMEWIFYPSRRLNGLDGLSFVDSKVGELNHLSSFDYSGFENQTLSLQAHWNQRWDCRDSHLLDCRLFQLGAKWLSMNLWNDFELENNFWIELQSQSFWYSLRLRRALGENFRAEILWDEFVSDVSGLYAPLARRDQVGFKIEWAF